MYRRLKCFSADAYRNCVASDIDVHNVIATLKGVRDCFAVYIAIRFRGYIANIIRLCTEVRSFSTCNSSGPVSYTHLTLPTNREV